MQIHLLSVVKIIWAKFDFFYRPSPRACHSHPCTVTSFRRNLGGRSEAARVDIWHLRQQFIYVCVLMCWCTCICYLMSAVCGHASSKTTHTHTHVYNYKPTLPPPLLFKMYKRLRAVEESTDLPTKIIYTQFKMYLKIFGPSAPSLFVLYHLVFLLGKSISIVCIYSNTMEKLQ